MEFASIVPSDTLPSLDAHLYLYWGMELFFQRYSEQFGQGSDPLQDLLKSVGPQGPHALAHGGFPDCVGVRPFQYEIANGVRHREVFVDSRSTSVSCIGACFASHGFEQALRQQDPFRPAALLEQARIGHSLPLAMGTQHAYQAGIRRPRRRWCAGC